MAKSSKRSTLDKFGTWEVLEDGSLFETSNNYHITPDRLMSQIGGLSSGLILHTIGATI
ncbi:hypothetical protein ACFFJX_02415 [Pseudarcicella hirudinis]|uniref:hypothetical protein n=1 Tax=Pseudarcicella hirudinis TaxID=1079859 RepID=UPI0035E6F7E6